MWVYTLLTRQSGASVSVAIDGETVMTLPLDEDTTVELGSGDHTNTLVIENGEAYVSAASCPDHICMQEGRIRYDGEMIVCLPNKLVVTVVGGTSAGTDAVSQ